MKKVAGAKGTSTFFSTGTFFSSAISVGFLGFFLGAFFHQGFSGGFFDRFFAVLAFTHGYAPFD